VSEFQVGKAAGLSNGHLGRIERGELDPSLSTQRRIADALEISLAELIGLAEEELERTQRRLGQGPGGTTS
jgi:transcriptional regulator with XRE-family HTH domain